MFTVIYKNKPTKVYAVNGEQIPKFLIYGEYFHHVNHETDENVYMTGWHWVSANECRPSEVQE